VPDNVQVNWSPTPVHFVLRCADALLQENVNRLKAYKSNLLIFPRHRNIKKPKAMDASVEDAKTATQLKGTILPISKAAPTLEKMAITADMKVRDGGRAWVSGARTLSVAVLFFFLEKSWF
jgi:hypothetical protein